MDKKEGLIVGRNAVMQALESDRTIDSVTVAEGQRGGQAAKIIEICRLTDMYQEVISYYKSTKYVLQI